MAAVACLRVLAGDAVEEPSAETAGFVGKLTNAFLDSRWVWPRRHGRVGPNAFLLADPRALEFDADELCALASEMQVKLFGVESAGEVSLLLFEGEQDEIMRFANCGAEMLKAALNGDEDAAPLLGRIRRVSVSGVETLAHGGDPDTQPTVTPEDLLERIRQAEPAAAETTAEPETSVGFHMVYSPPRQTAVGSAVSNGRLGASSMRGSFGNAGHIRGEAAVRYDTYCLEGGLPILGRPFGGLLFFPISFSSLVHRPTRELYLPILSRLPPVRRSQLVASVYDTPRDPSFPAVSELTAFLKTYFGFVDLGVTDPGFRVESLAAGMVNSVTLIITEQDSKARLATVRRFMDNRNNYKRQKIWPAVSHIRSRAELDFCLAQGAPFVSGPAVSDMLEAPASTVALTPGALPLRRPAPLDQCA
jgi:hypothetical protein